MFLSDQLDLIAFELILDGWELPAVVPIYEAAARLKALGRSGIVAGADNPGFLPRSHAWHHDFTQRHRAGRGPMRSWLTWGVALLTIGCQGRSGSGTETSNPVRSPASGGLANLGEQKQAPLDISGRWIVHRSVRLDSGIRVPSNLKTSAELGLTPPADFVPAKDSVVVFPRRAIESALVEFGTGGTFRDPSAQVVGDGLYVVVGDSVRITGPRGTLVFALVRSDREVFQMRGTPDTVVLPALLQLRWSDDDPKQTRLVMMRPHQGG
jgi:hypothetical protein